MAIIWSNKKNGTKYEVRSAGNSIRLYTDGVFHTQWNPQSPLAGHVWDLLFLSSCFYVSENVSKNISQQPPTKALILGVGGGAVINALRHFYPDMLIDGVELDSTHLGIAKKFFVARSKKTKLHLSCAQAFVNQNDTSRYDFIVEDLFLGKKEFGKTEARKAIDVDTSWLSCLSVRLADGGVLAINFESLKQCRHWLRPKSLKFAGIKSAFILSQSQYENVIAVLKKEKTSKSVFESNWKNLVSAFPLKDTAKCEFEISRL